MLFPEITGEFILECTPPDEVFIQDICWLDESTLIIAQTGNRMLLNAAIDIQAKNCTFRVIDTNYDGEGIVCTDDGSVYAAYHGDKTIRVYDKDGVWAALNIPPIESGAVAENTDKIIVSPPDSGPVKVYNKNLDLLYSLSVGGQNYWLNEIFVTESGVLVAIAPVDKKLIIHDLNDNSSVIVGSDDGQFDDPRFVSLAGDGILVSDAGNVDVSVFTLAGQFMHQIQFVGGGVTDPGAMAVTGPTGKPVLNLTMAVIDYHNVRFYRLSP